MKREPPSIRSRALTSEEDVFRGSQDFSLVLGGPLFQIFRAGCAVVTHHDTAGRTAKKAVWDLGYCSERGV
jgi:hypothetical protein